MHPEFRQAQSPDLPRDTHEKMTFALPNFIINSEQWKESFRTDWLMARVPRMVRQSGVSSEQEGTKKQKKQKKNME